MNKSLISAKRVFAIIGIVMGSVLAFVGAVFGVMAAMGKFKTPQVYPTHLQFETEKVIVAGNAYGDPAVKADIYSFQLSGTNASVKHEVNKKVCYIWFEKGSDLITLCDANGVPLERNSNNRYKVNCNEPIYYMVNKVANNYETDGTVVITARSENDKVKPDDPFTLYIDRKIETIYLTYGDVPKKGDTQNITVGVDIPFDFNYVINPNLAQNPITHADYTTKVPALYYVATGYSTDYVEVTETEVNNINSPLNKILTINNGKVTFKSTTAGSHQFKIAVFPTYEAKNKFNADKLENQITNYDKLTNYMTVTTLNVNVENIDINNVQLLGSNVVLNLYSENDYITLDGTSGVAGAKDNNLELKITKGEGQASIADYTRFDEVVMGGLQINENVTPTFKDSSNNVLGDITITKDVVKVTNLNLGELGTVIDYINYNGNIYYCDNGMAVMKEDGKINLITHGAYLDFYIHNSTDGDYEFKNLNYSATALNSGKAKSWNLISKELLDLEDYESLHLGIIVVNSQGVFNVNKLFDTIPVTLNEVALDYQIKLNNAELNVTYNDKGEAQFAEKTFNDFITINSGSYNSTVFVTEVTTSMIDTFNNVTFTLDDKQYALVGYKDKDGNFVNSVKVNSNVSNLHNSCKIYMLQLKNEYKQSVNDIITKEILESGKEFDQSIVRELFNESNQAITINSKYVLNPGLLTVEYYDVYGVDGKENKTTTKVDNVYQVFENTNTHRIVISSTDNGNMLDKVATYYAVSGKLNLLSSSVINIEPKAITYNLTDKKLIIDYDTKTDISTEAYITLSGIGTSLNFGPIKVLSGDPDNIIFNAECVDVDGTKTLTLCDIDKLETATSYIRVKVSYESDKYVYTYYFVEGDKAYKITSNVFNTKTSNEFEGLTNTAIGFHGAENKEQTLNVTYESANKELFDFNQGVLQAYKHGKNALIVTIGDTTKYVGFEIDASGFALKNKGTDITNSNSTIIADENPTKLADILTVNYNNTTNVPLTTNNYVYINDLFVDNYGDGTLTKLKNADGSWSLIKSTGITDNPETDVDESVTTILTIDANNEYSFDYTTPYIPLDIRITVQTIVGVKEIKISFTSSISVSVNDNWKNSRVFYTNTSVLLYSISADAVPVFDITSEGKNIEIHVSYGTVTDKKLSSSTFEVKDEHIGEISIEIFVGGNSIHTYTDFVVKPNVIATKTINNLTSNSNELVYTSVYNEVKKYNNITYGSSTTALYTDTNYAADAPTGLTLGFKKSENTDNLLSITDGKLTIGHMQDLNNSTERTIYLMYGTHKVSETVVTISNNYTAQLKDTLVKDGTVTLMAKTDYTVSDLITITNENHGYTLYSIAIECGEVLTIAYNEDKTTFSIDTFVSNIYNENVNIIFTFKNGDKTLIYNTSYNNNIKFEIVPFKPTEDGTKNNAYSGAEYDLLKERYNIETLKLDTKIKSLIVTNIYDENGISIKDSIIKSGTLTGYINGAYNPHCSITFNEIVGSAKLVKVEYTITYADEKSTTYVYTCDLTINNRQTINTPQYPEKGLTTTAKFKFVNNDYAKEYSGSSDIPADGNYQLTIENYEPILINSQAVLNLKEYDNIKHVNRIVVNNVENLTLFNGANTNTNLTITPIAYESVIGMANYFNNSVKITNDNEITFEADTKGLSGLIIFKVSTVSGNYAYYIVRVCSSSNTNLSLSKNVGYTPNEDDKTYADVISSIGYSDIFGKTYSNSTTSLYLYNTETLTADGVVNVPSYSKVEDTATIERTEQYQTITIGLLYSSVRDIYVYGTITIYVQPTTEVSDPNINTSQIVENTWSPEKPNVNGKYTVSVNGKYTASVNPSATKIDCPFNGTWAAEVVNINNDEYSDDNKYGISRDNENEITLANRVTEDTTIVVRYKRDNGTVVEVTYTYLKTSIPDEFTTVIGEFKNNEFNNTVTLNDKYLGTYANNITVSIGDETFGSDKTTIGNVEYNPTTKVLTFTQIHTQQNVDIKITYSTLKDANGNAVTKTFKFIVKEGVYVDDTSTENGSGLANARRKLADVTNVYSGADALTGSKLEFSYIDKDTDIDETTDNGNDTRNYYIYKIGGLIIYTVDNSYLELTVATEDQKYITNLTENKVTIDADKDTINFVHLATTKDININVAVYKSATEKYAERTFYATIAKTYTNIVANYVVEGATHENVVKGSTTYDIHNELLLSLNRFTLIRTVLDADGKTYNNVKVESFNLIDMGFATVGNPNYIDFSCNANGALKYTYDGNGNVTQVDIKFNEVDKNTMCVVYLNNQAGLTTNSVTYNYQIMATTSEDGLNYSNSSGIYESTQNYLSFVINDNKNGAFTSEKFIIGSMYDTANKKVFDIHDDTAYKHVIVDGQTDEEYTIVGDYKNAIQYKIQASDNYILYITANFESGNIELIVVRANNSSKETKISYVLNASGVNGGTNSMINNLKIIVFNYDIALNNPTETIYSGFIVDLTKKISVTNNGSTTSAITYEINTAESSYTVGGTTYNNESAIVDMENNKNLIINTIGYNSVLADLTFNIKQGNYIVDKVKYTFTINKNLHFVANGGDLTKNLTNNNPSTNFVLTKQSDDDKFPIEINFVASSDLKDTNYKTSSGKTYYNVLAIDLYIPYAKDNDGNIVIQNTIKERQNIKISLHSNHDDYVTVTNSSITFNKDFTGDIELLLTVNTGSAGTYSVVWNVNVFGILAQEYIVNGVNSNPDYNRVNSSSPFVSGTQVQLFTTESSSTKSGVKVTQPPEFTTSIGEIELIYSYKIIENNSTTSELTNKQLFTNENNNVYNTEFKKGDGGGDFTFGTVQLSQQIALPSVPSTDVDTSQTYFVVYMFYLKYLGLTYDEDEDINEVYVFYVTYDVINYQNVEVYDYEVTTESEDGEITTKHSSASVDVDSLTDNDNFLDLFYYKETLTISSGAQRSAAQSGEESTTPSTQEYSLTYSNKTIKFTDINGRTADITNKTEDTITFTATGTTDDDKNNYKYNKTTRTLFVEESGEYIDLGKMKQTPNDTTYHSVFNSGFTNIFDYASFINTYLNKESVLLTDTKTVDDNERKFKLVEYNNTGRYGIYLTEGLKEGEVLFHNEMLAELALIDNGIKTITVPAYSSGETSGFRLYTKNAIVANTKNAKGEEGIELSSIFLITHFTGGGEYYNDRIIGVGDPTTGDLWVNRGTANTSDTTYATIQIPSDNGNNTYHLKRVTYTATATGGSSLYELEKSYYYLAYETGTSALVVPDYIKAGLETTWFKIQYNPSGDKIKVDLTNAVKVWDMDGGKLVNNTNATYSDFIVISSTTDITPTLIDNKLTIATSALDTYKINHPEATEYPMITATIKVKDSITLKFNIEYMLDDYPKVTVDYTKGSTGNVTIRLVDVVTIPVKEQGTNVSYVKLVGDNLDKVTSIVEKGGNGYGEYNKDMGDLVLDGEKLKNYFDNTSKTQLKIIYTISTADGSYDFQVVVNETLQQNG